MSEKKAKQARRGPGRRGYSPETKEQARLLYLAGDTPADIGAALGGITERTIRGWAASQGWQTELSDRRSVAANLEAQIARISGKKAVSEGDTRKIAMLSKALARINKNIPKPKPRPVVQAAVSAEIMSQILDPAFGLYSYQTEFLEDDSRFRNVLKGRQIGFTYAVAAGVIAGAMAGRPQLVISASQLQAENVIKYALIHMEKLGLVADDKPKTNLIEINGTEIRAMPANFRTIQGWPGDVWLDEFAWHHNPRRIWDAIIPSITAIGGRVTITSTPFVPGSLFWEICTTHKGKYENFSQYVISLPDAVAQGMPLPGGIDELRSLFDSESWAMLYLCQWADDGSALLSWDLLHKLATGYEQRIYDGSIYSGVDVGRTNDRFVIANCGTEYQVGDSADKYKLLHVDSYKKLSFDSMRDMIDDVFKRYTVQRMQIDKTGIGMDLAESVEKKHSNAQGVWFTQKSKARLALNMLKLAEEKRLILPNDPAVLAQLHAVKKLSTPKGIKYDAARDDSGHADTFWAVALALDELGENAASNDCAAVIL